MSDHDYTPQVVDVKVNAARRGERWTYTVHALYETGETRTWNNVAAGAARRILHDQLSDPIPETRLYEARARYVAAIGGAS